MKKGSQTQDKYTPSDVTEVAKLFVSDRSLGKSVPAGLLVFGV